MTARGEVELPELPVSTSRTELGKTMSSVRPGAHKGAKRKGFRGKAWKDIKGVSGNKVREVRGYSDAVPTVGSLIGRGMNGRGRARKSRGRFRT